RIGVALPRVGRGNGELAGVAALRIVRAADEGAIFAQLKIQRAVAAIGAGARIAAIALVREDMGAEQVGQRVQHLGGAQILGAVEGRRKVARESPQDLLQIELMMGDPVELLFEGGGKIELDITSE